MRPTRAEINLEILKENVRSLRKIHKDRAFFCPMVKADAYGHGDVQVAQALAKDGINRFGVILVEEGMKLRQAGVTQDILVFGYFDKESMQEALANNLIPVISSFASLENVPKDKKVKIHLKFDSGMSRLGFQLQDAGKVLDFISSHKNIEVEGIGTHFLNSDDSILADGWTVKQMKVFAQIEKMFEGKFKYSHCRNSGALVADFQGTEEYHKNPNFLGARPGISIYGYPPTIKDHPADLRPVMTLNSAVVQLRTVKKGDVVSYGATWKAQKDSTIGTVCIGYGDGYPRNLSNNSSMIFRGQRVPVVGRVCMDYLMVDLSDFKNEAPLQIGETITVWGYQGKHLLSAEELAKNMNTISYELVTGLTSRVPRVYVGL